MRKTVATAAVLAACAAPSSALAAAPVQQTTTFESTQPFVSPTTGEPAVFVGTQTERTRVHTQRDGDLQFRDTTTFQGTDTGGGTASTRDDFKLRTQNGSVTTDQKAGQNVQPSGGGGFTTQSRQRTTDGQVKQDRFRASCGGAPC